MLRYKNNTELSYTTARRSAATLRVNGELSSLEGDLPRECKVELPNANDALSLVVTVSPRSGYYRDGTFKFTVKVPGTYPHDPPKVKCLNKILHPNIDTDGSVCLNILGVGWNPVLSLYSVIVGLLDLFFNPQVDDPLNKAAAEMLRVDSNKFADVVRSTMRGGSFMGHAFDCVL